MELTNNKNKLISILPFVISIIFFIILLYVCMKYRCLSIDEGYTRGILNLNVMDMISVTANDVHPPLYYLIAALFIKIANALSFNVDFIFLIKFPSIIPYLIILLISLTKIRKEYGLLAGGIFSLTLIAMSEFFTYYITARMYSWTMIFLVISFLYVKDVLEHNDLKSWILLSIFSVLGAYTHYFSMLTTIIIYLMLFVWILANKENTPIKDSLKKFFISAILGIIIYIPWIFTLIQQLGDVQESFWLPPLTIGNLIEYFSYTLTISNNQIIRIMSLLLILALFLIFIMKFLKNKNNDNLFLLIGCTSFIGTLVLSLILSIVYKPILYSRYMLPSIGIFWLCVSIKLANLKVNKSIILMIILLIAIVGAFNVYHEVNEISDLPRFLNYSERLLSGIDNNDTIIIYDADNRFIRTHSDLTNVYKQFGSYSLNNETSGMKYKSPDVCYDTFVIPDDLNKYPNKNVYLIMFHSNNLTLPDNVHAEKIGTVQHGTFYKLKLV